MNVSGDSDGDQVADGHHYEALYEVINPRLATHSATPSATPDIDSYDDSFDSDDAFEEDTVRGAVTISFIISSNAI